MRKQRRLKRRVRMYRQERQRLIDLCELLIERITRFVAAAAADGFRDYRPRSERGDIALLNWARAKLQKTESCLRGERAKVFHFTWIGFKEEARAEARECSR